MSTKLDNNWLFRKPANLSHVQHAMVLHWLDMQDPKDLGLYCLDPDGVNPAPEKPYQAAVPHDFRVPDMYLTMTEEQEKQANKEAQRREYENKESMHALFYHDVHETFDDSKECMERQRKFVVLFTRGMEHIDRKTRLNIMFAPSISTMTLRHLLLKPYTNWRFWLDKEIEKREDN